SGTDTRLGSDFRAREVRLFENVFDPDCFPSLPNKPRQTHPRPIANLSGQGHELGKLRLQPMPDIDAMHYFSVARDFPERATFPADAFAYRLENARCCIFEIQCLSQHASDGMFDRQTALRPLALGDIAEVRHAAYDCTGLVT